MKGKIKNVIAYRFRKYRNDKMIFSRGNISLIYNNRVIQYLTFDSLLHRQKIIDTWFKVYALNQPKKYPVFIDIKFKTNKRHENPITLCNTRIAS